MTEKVFTEHRESECFQY